MDNNYSEKLRDKLDHIIDRIGFGKFQVISMLGLGCRIFVRGSILSSTAILEPHFQCLYKLSPLSASFYLTGYLMSGAFASWPSGYISDIYGKRKAIILLCSMSAFILVLQILCQSFAMLVVTMLAYGLFENATFLVHPYLLEVLPISKRKYLSLMEVFNVIGFCSGILITNACIRYASWQIAIIISAILPLLIVIAFAWFMPESPRYSFSKRDKRVLSQTFFQMMDKNNVKLEKDETLSVDMDSHLSSDSFSEGDSDEGSASKQLIEKATYLSNLNRSVKRNVSLLSLDAFRKVLVSCVLRFTASFCLSVLIYASGQRYTLNSCSDCHVNVGIINLISTCLGISITIIASYNFIHYCKRRVTFLILLSMLSLLVIPFYFGPSGWIQSALIVALSVCADCSLVVLNVYVSEVVPTSVRGLTIGLVIGAGYFGELAGAFLAAWVFHVNFTLSLSILHTVVVICLIMVYLFAIETKDISLS